ncbi:MAG: hypothetical protein ACFFDN_37740 [Candidatus Hodarchaeota archaeon]
MTKNKWEDCEIVINKKQKDYEYLEKEDINVFIYGYPFNEITKCWISAIDIYDQYSKNELNFVHHIEGVYGIIIIDRQKGKCSVIIDRYGVYNFFYFKNSNHFIISDKISEIIAFISSIKLNEHSIIEYLIFGYGLKLGNKTHIEGIYEFEGSIIYQIDRALNMTQERYWEFLSKSKKKITNEKFQEIFNLHILTGLNLEEMISFPLTGGLDTRTIMSASLSKKDKLHCCTYGVKNAVDVRLAKEITNHFGIKHSFYELDGFFIKNLPNNLEKNIDLFNGLIPTLNHLSYKELCEREEKMGELMVWGLLGNEVWRSFYGYLIKKKQNITINDLAHLIARGSVNRNLVKIFKNYNKISLLNLLKNSVKNEFSNIPNTTNTEMLLDLFTFRNFSSNWASNLIKFCGTYFKIFLALINKKLLVELQKFELEERISGSIQKYIITNNNSYLANLPLNTGQSISPLSKCKNLFNHIIYLINEYSEMMIKRRIFKISKQHGIHNWLRNYHKDFIINTLNYEKMVTKNLFKKEVLDKIINLYLNGNNSVYVFISSLISLEIWLKKIKKETEIII